LTLNTQTPWARRRGFGAQVAIRSRWPEDVGREMVCAPKATAMRVLESLVLRGIPPGPVVADLRGEAPRVGFVVSARDCPDRTALHDWIAQSGWRSDVRVGPHHGSAVSKSVFRVPLGRLRWVIPPGGSAAETWPLLGLLAALTDATTTPDVTRLRW
jgi:hypothetical protein